MLSIYIQIVVWIKNLKQNQQNICEGEGGHKICLGEGRHKFCEGEGGHKSHAVLSFKSVQATLATASSLEYSPKV